MEDILIRPAGPEDTEGIIAHRVGIASEPDTFVSYTAEEANRAVEKERERIIKQLEEGDLCLVAVAEDRIIAEIRLFSGSLLFDHSPHSSVRDECGT